MRWLYTTGIFFYVYAIRAFAFFGNRNAKKWVIGRRNLLSQYKILFATEEPGNIIWFHVSSLGEFEQGRSVIENAKNIFKDKKILLTFFSPSGYEVQKNYRYADYVLYLPHDCLIAMRKFVSVVRPCAVFFVKYDFWFNFITACKEKNIPVFFISAVFRPEQYFFRWWGIWFRKQLKNVTNFFVQTQFSVQLLNKYGIENVIYAGDTRIDRVLTISEEKKRFTEIEKFIADRKMIIAGSTWPADEKFIFSYLKRNKEICFIIAPHDVSETRLKNIESSCRERIIRFSDLQKNSNLNARILLIDCIGILSYLYKYSYVAIIGNGFGKGIHNILEAVVFNVPVVFGPNYKKFNEAVELINKGGAFTFTTISEFENIMDKLLINKDLYQKASQVCKQYVEQNRGASDFITEYLVKKLNFRNI